MSALRHVALTLTCLALALLSASDASALGSGAPDRQVIVKLSSMSMVATPFTGINGALPVPCPSAPVPATFSATMYPARTVPFMGYGVRCNDVYFDQTFKVTTSSTRTASGHPASVTISNTMHLWKLVGGEWKLWSTSLPITKDYALPADSFNTLKTFPLYAFSFSSASAKGTVYFKVGLNNLFPGLP
jgi:hypothetical protein